MTQIKYEPHVQKIDTQGLGMFLKAKGEDTHKHFAFFFGVLCAKWASSVTNN